MLALCATVVCAQEAPQQEASFAAPLAWKEPPLADYGISTTIEEGRGNWYMKKQQVKAALELQKRIENLVNTVVERRSILDEAQALVEGQAAQFFATAGFAPSELDERLSLIVQQIEKGGAQAGLTEQDRAVIAEAETRKKEVAALRADLELLKRLLGTVTEAVRVAHSEITKAERYRQEAAELYDAIDDTISDERGERLLATMRAHAATLEAIDQYVSVDLPRYCQQTMATIGQTIASLEKRIADLKSKGLSLEKKVQEEKKKQPAPKPAPPAAWYQRIWTAIGSFFGNIAQAIYGAIAGALGLIGIKI